MKKQYNIEEKKRIENELRDEGYKHICGVDEVGRGPLAGPVVCAAVILPADCAIEGIDDSKKLSEKRREEISEQIINEAISYSIQFIFEEEIDKLNILNATKKGMVKAVNSLSVMPDIVLIDGNQKIDIETPQKTVIHGDSLVYSIGAASIIAKVARDRFMKEQDAIYPQFAFKENKGYGTKAHMDALRQFGPCKIHRKTFLKFLGDRNEQLG